MDVIETKLRGWLRSFGWWLRGKLFGEAFEEARIEPEVVEDICALAAGAYPNEMIAFLTGSVKKERGVKMLVVDGLYVKSYHANRNSTHFTIHDLPLSGVYGTVHSHPSSSTRPSGADRQLFSRYGWFHLIIGKPYQRENISVYNKLGEPIDSVTY